MLVEVIFQYRTLIGKAELGCGLDWDDIDQVTGIEAKFAPAADDRRAAGGRRFKRELLTGPALLRGDRINDRVELVDVAPGGIVCRRAPYVAVDELIELTIEIGETSYRFSARGVWQREDGDDYTIGLQFVGMPVAVNRARISARKLDLVDQIAA